MRMCARRKRKNTRSTTATRRARREVTARPGRLGEDVELVVQEFRIPRDPQNTDDPETIKRLCFPLESVNAIEPLAGLAKLIEKGETLTPRQRSVAACILDYVSVYISSEQRRPRVGTPGFANTDINARVANVLVAEFQTRKTSAAAAAVTGIKGKAAAVNRVLQRMKRLKKYSLLHQVLDAVLVHGDTFSNNLREAACLLNAPLRNHASDVELILDALLQDK
jgi:hypothetical protein